MANKNPLIFPEVINNFNVYNDGNKLLGITGEVTLPELNSMTATIQAAGILGEYETNVIGMFQNMQQEIPFRIINEEFFDLMRGDKQAALTLRGSIQNVDKQTGGAISTQGMRVVLRGRPVAAKMGQLKQGDLMNASITLGLTYILIEIGGQSKLELDKLNSIYKVNGEDVLKDIMSQC